MRKTITIALIFLCFGSAMAQMEAPPLPRWVEEDAQQLLAGEDLLTDALFQPFPEQELAAPVMEGVVLPDPALREQHEPTEISEADLHRFFAEKPQSFLVDPQQILTSQESSDVVHFLTYHDSDSTVNFFVYVFGAQQTVPSHIDADQLLATFFGDAGPTVLLFYHVGDPARSDIFLSRELYRSVGQAEKKRSLQSAIHSALGKSEPADQLIAFCVQLSHRIYGMEKAFHAGVIAPVEVEEQMPTEPMHRTYLAALSDWWREWQLPVTLSIAVMAVAGLAGLTRRLRRRYRLPTFPAPQRLGASDGAGVGAHISFANPHLPPSAQRQKSHDDLDLL